MKKGNVKAKLFILTYETTKIKMQKEKEIDPGNKSFHNTSLDNIDMDK